MNVYILMTVLWPVVLLELLFALEKLNKLLDVDIRRLTLSFGGDIEVEGVIFVCTTTTKLNCSLNAHKFFFIAT